MIDTILTYTADLDRGVTREAIRPALLTLDDQAHTFRVACKRGNANADLTGCQVRGYFVRADGATVMMDGAVEGSVASVTLSSSCYAVPGRYQLVMKLNMNGVVSAIFYGDGSVSVSQTDSIVDNDHVVPSLDAILQQLEAAEAATQAANTAADNADRQAATAESAAQDAATQADAAQAAAAGINGMTVSAQTLEAGSAATASVSDVNGSKNIAFGIPKGDAFTYEDFTADQLAALKGPKGDAALFAMEVREDGHLYVVYDDGVPQPPLSVVDGHLIYTVDGETDQTVDLGNVTPPAYTPLDAYPVGSIYLSVSSVSPADLFGGTWEQLPDRFLLGAGSTYAAGSTGGEATHTLTIDEMPQHTHTVSWDKEGGTGTGNGILARNSLDGNWPYGYQTGATGGSAAHNNMPPYLAVYMWKRTA